MPDAGAYRRMKQMAMELMGMVESYEKGMGDKGGMSREGGMSYPEGHNPYMGGMDAGMSYGDKDMYNGGSNPPTQLGPEMPSEYMMMSGVAGSGSSTSRSMSKDYDSMDSNFRGDSSSGTYGGRGYSPGSSYSMDGGKKQMMANKMKSSMSYRRGRKKKKDNPGHHGY